MSKLLTLFQFPFFFFWTVQCVCKRFTPGPPNLSMFQLNSVSFLSSLFDEDLSQRLRPGPMPASLPASGAHNHRPRAIETALERVKTRHLTLSASLTAPATQLGQHALFSLLTSYICYNKPKNWLSLCWGAKGELF